MPKKLSLLFLGLALLPQPSFGVACDPTSPNCFIAPLIQNRCATCHDRVQSDFGRLDMSKWVPMPDGTFWFPHLAPDGRQLTPVESFNIIWFRVTHRDPNWRMPLGDRFNDQELGALRAWMNGNPDGSSQEDR